MVAGGHHHRQLVIILAVHLHNHRSPVLDGRGLRWSTVPFRPIPRRAPVRPAASLATAARPTVQMRVNTTVAAYLTVQVGRRRHDGRLVKLRPQLGALEQAQLLRHVRQYPVDLPDVLVRAPDARPLVVEQLRVRVHVRRLVVLELHRERADAAELARLEAAVSG